MTANTNADPSIDDVDIATDDQFMYSIQATIDGHQVPTFYLDARVQGIVSEDHAERIAREVIDPLHILSDTAVHVHAMLV